MSAIKNNKECNYAFEFFISLLNVLVCCGWKSYYVQGVTRNMAVGEYFKMSSFIIF